jgi:hypothetical protein
LFGTVEGFVPPDERFGRAGLRAVKGCGMDALYYPTLQHRSRDADTLRTVARDTAFKLRYRRTGLRTACQDLYRFHAMEDRSTRLPVRPFPYRVGGGWEFTDVTLLPTSDPSRLRTQLRLAARLNGSVCLSVAHWRFEEPAYRERFESLLGYARDRLDARPVTVGALFP